MRPRPHRRRRRRRWGSVILTGVRLAYRRAKNYVARKTGFIADQWRHPAKEETGGKNIADHRRPCESACDHVRDPSLGSLATI
jgi:hypothetical protein